MGLGMIFHVEWWWNYGEIRSGDRFKVDLEIRKHFHCITNDFDMLIFSFLFLTGQDLALLQQTTCEGSGP